MTQRGRLGGAREPQEGGDIRIDIADTLSCTVETSNIVKQLYYNFKKEEKEAKFNSWPASKFYPYIITYLFSANA